MSNEYHGFEILSDDEFDITETSNNYADNAYIKDKVMLTPPTKAIISCNEIIETDKRQTIHVNYMRSRKYKQDNKYGQGCIQNMIDCGDDCGDDRGHDCVDFEATVNKYVEKYQNYCISFVLCSVGAIITGSVFVKV